MPPTSPSSPDEQDRFQQDLERAANGDRAARDRLWAENYEMLRDCASAWFAQNWRGDRRDPVSIGGTHIVNSAYGRLLDRTAAMSKGRAFFFKCFYTECLRIVIDHYRKTRHHKGRGELGMRQELDSRLLRDQGVAAGPDEVYDILAELEKQDPNAGLVAMLKVFENCPDEKSPGAMRGLTNQEVADMLELGLRTVEKHWQFAKAWLLTQLQER